MELYKKYGKRWNLIAKKIPGKTDKQIMYKINSLQHRGSEIIKMDYTSVRNMDVSKVTNTVYKAEKKESVNDMEDEDEEVERLPSGEQYKHMIYDNRQSGSSSFSSSSHYNKTPGTHMFDNLHVIPEEGSRNDGCSARESESLRV